MKSLVRQIVNAAGDWDDSSDLASLVHVGPNASCAALGSVLAHVMTTLVNDRRLLTQLLDQRVEMTR